MTDQILAKKPEWLGIFSSPWFKAAFALIVIGALVLFNRIELSVFAPLKETYGWLILALILMMPRI